jgi:DNA-binding MarR family transcriptional regulator/GNAT superfamily N-acetyltransferase
MSDPTPWLTSAQLRAWMRLVAVIELLPAALDQQLQRDADLNHFDYMVIAMLSEQDDRTLRMSALASATNASLPRLSHVVSRLEKRGYVARCPSADDRRATDVRLTDAGWEAIVAAAPDHVRTARRFVIDALSTEQVEQLEGISRAMLARLDPEGRFAAPAGGPLAGAGPAACDVGASPCVGITFRGATDADADRAVLRRATLDAMNWTDTRFVDADLDRPEFRHYFAAFDPARDRGVVADDDRGPVAAAWAVFLPEDDPGYGFVAPDVPELTMAVDARGRGRGIGTEILRELVARGVEAEWRGISLSVEDGNIGARALYERVGFRTVGRNGDSDTMLLTLADATV